VSDPNFLKAFLFQRYNTSDLVGLEQVCDCAFCHLRADQDVNLAPQERSKHILVEGETH
jgi:hypothetical protein